MTSLHSVAHLCAWGLKSEHYPSLELCKRLTCRWFPETEKWEYFTDIDTYLEKPSIAELLDELPKVIEAYGWFALLSILYCYPNGEKVSIIYKFLSPVKIPTIYTKDDWTEYAKMDKNTTLHCLQEDTLPDALAEMWIWLKENNLLPKIK